MACWLLFYVFFYLWTHGGGGAFVAMLIDRTDAQSLPLDVFDRVCVGLRNWR